MLSSKRESKMGTNAPADQTKEAEKLDGVCNVLELAVKRIDNTMPVVIII